MSHLPELLAELLSEADARDLVDRVGLDARYIEFHGHLVNVWNNILRARGPSPENSRPSSMRLAPLSRLHRRNNQSPCGVPIVTGP